MLTKGRTYLMLIMTLILMSSPASAAEVDEEDKEFLFLGNEYNAPFIYEENNLSKGLLVDIVKNISKKSAYNIQVKAIDWEDAQNKVLSGEADALLQMNPNPEREYIYDFSTEVLKSEFSIFKKSGNSGINSIEDLRDKKVGVDFAGYPHHILKRYKDIDMEDISDWASAFEMIEAGLLDAVVVDRWVGEYVLTKSKVQGIQVLEEPIDTKPSYIAVRKGNDELLQLINKGLKEMKDDGTMDKILSSWRGESVVYFTENQIRQRVYAVFTAIIVLIILAALFIINKLRRVNHQLELKVVERTKELYKANETLKEISVIDGLTGIHNRRHFDYISRKNWGLALKEKQPLTLLLLDIDHFKRCNDMYGHLAGDEYLKTIARILKKSIKRSGDLVARYGGEEFVALLPNTPEESGRMLAEAIRKTVENKTILFEGDRIKNTVSIGVASLIPNGDLELKDLIRLADEAMYQAKDKGRNQVVVAG